MFFFIGIGMAGRVFVGFVFLSEHQRVQDTPKVTAFMFVIDALAIFVSAVYFRLFSKDWRYLYLMSLLAIAVALVALLRQYDTPKFYYGTGQYDMARMVLTDVGRTNGVLQESASFTRLFREELAEVQRGS
mmetsp:Transcript_13167/g.22312  ORF Transcript_13167/g.22312 Transcript_13167/m.22312 type:complete len:131 (+) Transcript_13167:814-1206(+)